MSAGNVSLEDIAGNVPMECRRDEWHHASIGAMPPVYGRQRSDALPSALLSDAATDTIAQTATTPRVAKVVAARFAMYPLACEALEEGRLWFADEDLICVRAVAAAGVTTTPAEAEYAEAGYLMMRVRSSEEEVRAVGILIGRGATRVDVLCGDVSSDILR